MGQSLDLKIAGLYTYPSDLSSVPPGALAVADGIVIDEDNTAEPRRGFTYLTYDNGLQSQFSNPSFRANRLFFYQSQILTQYSTNLLAYNDVNLGITNYAGTFNPPNSTTPIRSAQASQNFYFTTSFGVYKLDIYNGTPSPIGAPPGLDLSVTSSATAPVWLLSGYSTAYRILWGITDVNQNLILGAPSQRAEFTNITASTISTTVVATIPEGITTAHFYQLYRAQSVNTGLANDELGLVFQANPTNTDLSNGFVTISDVTPDTLRGATIYTAQSQLGLANSNEPPPFALDLAEFRNCLFYGNTQSLQNFNLTLLGTGSPNGIQSGDTVTIAGITYTAGSTENVSTATFEVYPVFLLDTTGTTHGTNQLTSVGSVTGVAAGQLITDLSAGGSLGIPQGTYVLSVSGSTVTMSQSATLSATGAVSFSGDSSAEAIRDTALSLVRVINRHSGSLVYAFYESSDTDLPGQILLQGRSQGQAVFQNLSSRATCWSPALASSGTSNPSIADMNRNYIFYSQPSEPESVPLGNFIPIGSAGFDILRIIALRDSLFILKTDGVFILYGTDPSNFQVSPLDYTAILIAPDSAVVLNNQIYCLTTQGVVAISETGVQIMSHPIEDEIKDLITIDYPLLQTSTFGVAYESDRAYYLFCITNEGDTSPTQYFRYNYITNTWVHDFLSKNCGGVNPLDDKLYLGNTGLPIIDEELKTLTYADYADYSSTQTITAVSGTQVSITSSDTIQIGSILFQSASVFATVIAVNTITGVVTTTLASSLVPGPCDVYAPISCVVQWVPVTFDNAGLIKQIREVALLFKSDFNGSALVSFFTEINPQVLSETIPGGNVGSWGEFGWGGPAETILGVPWGGANRRRPIRISVPRNHQRSTLLSVSFSHAYGFSPFQLQGISLIGDAVSERVSN